MDFKTAGEINVGRVVAERAPFVFGVTRRDVNSRSGYLTSPILTDLMTACQPLFGRVCIFFCVGYGVGALFTLTSAATGSLDPP